VKTLSPALQAHYAQGTTTLTTCWKATLKDGTVVAATAFDRDIVFGGVTYQATLGYSASDIDSSAELNPDNLEVQGVLGSPAITDDDIHSGRWDYAAIEIFEVNYADLSQGKNILRVGTLGEVRGSRSQFNAELRGLLQAYTRVIVRLVTKDCTADLGDARCTVDLAPITVSGVVGSVTDNRTISDAARVEAADWFTGGKLTFTSGANAGRSMEVKHSAPGQIELMHPFYEVIAAGDTFTVYAGCLKRFAEDCIAKHGNGVNFRGFPHLPGAKIFRQGGINYGEVLAAQSGSGGPTPTPAPTPAPSGGGGGTTTGGGGTPATYTPTLFVSASGSDSNSGTSAGAPFKTITHAAAVAVAGDVISVAPGTYSGSFQTTKSGSSGARLVYVSATRWGAKIVPPAASARDSAWFNTGQYVTIDGFDIDGSTDPASGTKWRFGIESEGEGTIVQNCHVHHIALTVPATSSGGGGILLDSYNGGQNMQALSNFVHHVGPVGGGNWFHGIYSTASGAIKNNIVGRVVGAGIHLWHDARNVVIACNTSFNNKYGIVYGGGDFRNLPPPCDHITVANNIFDGNSAGGVSEEGTVGANCIVTNNLCYNSGANYSMRVTTPANQISGNPLFVNYQPEANGDYHLLAGSPAIGAGLATYAPATDYEGTTRARADIGAYEGPP
jgi:uncharacterized phage protein (TIGR02218 family)